MCDDDIHPGLVTDPTLSRRTFGLAAAATAGLATAARAQVAVVEKDVQIKTADGVADGALFYPKARGTYPAVLLWADIMGLRPAMRDMARRLAGQGYVVLAPNPFYRSKAAPVMSGAIDFSDPQTRQTLMGYRKAMSDEGVDRDAAAYVAFLDAQPQTDRKKGVGVQGYCMGGSLSFRTAAAVPKRIRAVGSFHGGNGLVTAEPNSPHLLLPANPDAEYLVAQAKNDDAQNPQMKDQLKAAFAAAKVTATIEVYPADHGWCVPGSKVYDAASAERAWSELSALYKRKLV